MKQLSLRRRLYVLILAVLIPLVVLQFVAIFTRYERAIQSELQADHEFADAISVTFTNYLRDLWGAQYVLGTTLSGQPDLPAEKIEEAMHRLETVYPAIQGLAWINPSGVVVATTQVSPQPPFSWRGKNVMERDYMKRILLGQDEVVSDLIIGDNNHLTLPVARAIRQDGLLLGIVVAGLDVAALDEILPIHRGGKTGAFGLIDRKGKIVYHNLHSDLSYEQRALTSDAPALKALLGEQVIARDYQSHLTNERRMGVHLPITKIGWVSFASGTYEEVLAGVRFDTARDIVVLIFVAAFALIVAVFMGNQILRPVFVIQQTAQTISQGELTARTNIKGDDELSRTGQIFDEMAERIQELEISRTRFLQTAAHELRNPMAGIKGILSLVRRRMVMGKPLGDISQMLEVMDREIDRLSALLNQILEAFRTQRDKGQLALILKKVNLVDVVYSTLKPFQLTVNKCRFVRDIAPNHEVWVAGDSARLEEVIRNLLSNAVKYSPNGGEIRVKMRVHDEGVLLSVSDQGIGIPKEQLSRIFDCFYRASNLEKRDPGGMGLGLYICKEIIEGHDGTIWAESEEGLGSTFYIKLPLYKHKEEI